MSKLTIRHNFTERYERGQAIVPVIFVMLILTTLAITFATSARREIRASSNFDLQTERFFAAKGAVNYAASALAQSSNNGATYGIVSPGPDTDANGWMQIGEAWVKIEVTDTAGLLNINSATAAAFNRLPVFQQNPDLVAAITDWRTPGDQPSQNGAKSEYYNTLSPSYDCKSAPFDSVEELLLVKGMSPTILYGTVNGTAVDSSTLAAQSQNGAAGSGSTTRQVGNPRPGAGSPGAVTPGGSGGASPGGGGGAVPTGGGAGAGTGAGAATPTAGDTDWTDIYSNSTVPLSEMLTTLAWERNVASDGSARININTATAEDLTGIGLPSNLANGLVRFRSGGGQGGGGGNRPPGGGAGGQGGAGGGGNRPPGGGVTPGNGGGNVRPGGGGVTPGNGGGNVRPGGGSGAGPGNGGSNVRPGSGSAQSLERDTLPDFSTTRQAGNGTGPGNGGNVRPGSGSGGGPGTGGGGSGQGGGAGATGGGGAGGGAQSGPVFKTIADLLSVQGFTQPIMQQIADKISIDDMAYHDGLVNVNTASQEVLATVPGMDHATLQAIQTYRQGGQAFQGIGDLFALPGLTRQQFQNVIAHLCTKSSFYRVRVKVRMAGRESLYTITALVQLTENGPQVLQWKEVQRTPGWAFWLAPPTLPAPTPSSSGSSTSGTSSPSGATSGG